NSGGLYAESAVHGTEKRILGIHFIFQYFIGVPDQSFYKGAALIRYMKIYRPVNVFKAVKRPRVNQGFQRFFIDRAQIHSGDKVKNITKYTVFIPFFDDGINSCVTCSFNATESETDLMLFVDAESF